MSEPPLSKKPTKAITKASEAAAGWPSVRAFLLSHPDLARTDGELLAQLGLRNAADNVLEFGPAALARHIEAHRRESAARAELETTARANFVAQAQCHAGVVDLLEARNNADLARRLDETAQLRFGLTCGALLVEGPAPAGWRSLEEGMVNLVMGPESLSRLGKTGFGSLIYPEGVTDVGSVAMIRLALWGRQGMLVFAAAQEDAFTPDMGVELIDFIARVVERTAERWPVL